MSDQKDKNTDNAADASDDDIILDDEALAQAAAQAQDSAEAMDSDDTPEEELDPIAALEAERDELKDQALRAMAEVENMRRRTERELSQSRKYGHANFARDLISAVENLKRAVDVLPEDRTGLDETMANLVIGVEMISQEINTVFEKHGVQVIDPMGEKFDYEKHQAMFEMPTNDIEPGVVMQVAQRGWMLHDRLLTPAMVGVSKSAEDEKTEK